MSETRMTDEEFEFYMDPLRRDSGGHVHRPWIEAEVRRARAAETDLAAQLAASQAECERLRSERDAAREALEHMRICRSCGETDLGDCPEGARLRAALSPPAPKVEAQAKETP